MPHKPMKRRTKKVYWAIIEQEYIIKTKHNEGWRFDIFSTRKQAERENTLYPIPGAKVVPVHITPAPRRSKS